jgi:Protein of unknown function (DUF3298)/Deacetylase PdaC
MNKYSYHKVLILICAIGVYGCKNNAVKSENVLEIVFKSESKIMKSGSNCDLPDSLMTECAILDISWLTPLNGDISLQKSISDTLDIYIKGMIAECIYPEEILQASGSKSVDSLARIYFSQHQSFINEFPDAATNSWSISISVDSVFQNPKVLTLAVNGYTYLGGAHPNSFTSYHNFDKSTGKTLSLTDIIKDQKAFMTISEKEFRKNQEITDEQNLEEAGYFFDNGIYQLPTQYAVTADGLLLFYNNYEAAAYAVGQISYTIPFDVLVGIVDIEKVK